MCTTNTADTVMFQNLGKYHNPRLQLLKSAIEEAGTHGLVNDEGTYAELYATQTS